MTSKVSRLDRQVILLETGSTQIVRNVAADQMGDLAKQHPEDILNLLSRVYPFLLVKKWETRVTAARAVGGIVKHATLWDPNENDDTAMKPTDNTGDAPVETAQVKLEQDIQLKLEEFSKSDETSLLRGNQELYSLSQWNLNALFKSGKVLLASNMNDFMNNNNISVNENPKKQLKVETESNQNVKKEQGTTTKKSARMLAMAKRKKKIQAKNATSKPVDITESSVSKTLLNQQNKNNESTSPVELTNPKLEITEQTDPNKILIESTMLPILEQQERVAGLVWQFQGIYELLLENLTSDIWEVRHGAALGLRELMKKHASSVSRVKGKSRQENDLQNRKSLEDLATRLLTVFALDRFGDYVYDTVVAPVRESVAQTLAALLIHLDDNLSLTIFKTLEQLVLQDPQITGLPNKIWEATHGGLLGIRYFVSIKTDFLLSNNLLDRVVNIVLYGLNQSDDDVQSVAASILTPITSEFVKMDSEKIDVVLTTIWTSLTHLEDDLSASVGSVMDLLANLCKHTEVLDILKKKAIKYPSELSLIHI